MQRLGTVKRLVGAVIGVAAMAVVGGPSSALALGFGNGDLGFFVYGGNDQRYENFGANSIQSVLGGSSVTTGDISDSLPSLSVGAATGLRYSLMGTSADGLSFYVSTTASTITSNMNNNSFPLDAAGNFQFWAGQHAAATGGFANTYANNPSITAASAPHSFTSFLGTDGSINGGFNFITHGSLGQALNIFKVNIDGEATSYVRVASAILGTNGQLTITPSAVPVPAAVVLFGTGLVGLVGIARRKMAGSQAA